MTAGLQAMAADEFIYTTLHNDPTLTALLAAAYTNAPQYSGQDYDTGPFGTSGAGLDPPSPEIYSDTIPTDVTYPYVIFQLHTPIGDLMVVNLAIIVTSMDYLVRVVDRGQSYLTIAPIYARIHTLLHGATGTVADGTVYACYRTKPYKLPEIDDAIQYRMMGGIYRLVVQS